MCNPPATSIGHLYVITRRDIPHQAVQIAHGALAATFAYGEPPDQVPHPNLVVCVVESEAELAALFERLKQQGVRCVSWREEDMGGQLTAVATAPLRGAERKPLKRLRLL